MGNPGRRFLAALPRCALALFARVEHPRRNCLNHQTNYADYTIAFKQDSYPGDTPMKNWLGMCGPLPKTLLWKSKDLWELLHHRIYHLTKTRYPIYDTCDWHSCPKHNLWRAFVDGLTDNDKKCFLLKKNRTRLQKPYPIYDRWQKPKPYLWRKRLKNHILWGCTYLYNAYKDVPSEFKSGVAYNIIRSLFILANAPRSCISFRPAKPPVLQVIRKSLIWQGTLFHPN